MRLKCNSWANVAQEEIVEDIYAENFDHCVNSWVSNDGPQAKLCIAEEIRRKKVIMEKVKGHLDEGQRLPSDLFPPKNKSWCNRFVHPSCSNTCTQLSQLLVFSCWLSPSCESGLQDLLCVILCFLDTQFPAPECLAQACRAKSNDGLYKETVFRETKPGTGWYQYQW